MKYTDQFTQALSSSLRGRAARRSSTSGMRRSATPRHEALAIGLGCDVHSLGRRPEWR